MPQTVLVDSLDVRRKNLVFFCYLFKGENPHIKQYRGTVEDFFQTVSGETYLILIVNEIDGYRISSMRAIFCVNNIIRESFKVKG